MSGRIIAVVNQKGGAGKTTISMQLAGTLKRRGYTVMVADSDKQLSAQNWSAAAPEEKPFPAAVVGMAALERRVGREVVEKYLDLYNYIIIDCPPAVDSVAPRSALGVADLALIPILPSPVDIRATLPFRGLVDEKIVDNEDLRPYLLRNRWKPRTELARACENALQEFGFPVMRSFLGDLEAFKKAAMGCTVHDLSRKEGETAVSQIEALCEEIIKILEPAQPTLVEAG